MLILASGNSIKKTSNAEKKTWLYTTTLFIVMRSLITREGKTEHPREAEVSLYNTKWLCDICIRIHTVSDDRLTFSCLSHRWQTTFTGLKSTAVQLRPDGLEKATSYLKAPQILQPNEL